MDVGSYSLKFREKCGNAYHRQALRMGGMLLRHPLASCRQGILKAMVGLTYDCQCSCSYCCSGLYPRDKENELSEGEVRALLDDISRLPSLLTLVSFFGGEAMLKDYLFRLIEYACSRGLFTETETNGMLLSEQKVKRLKESGLHHIFVRIENTDPALHDAISGLKGCFKNAVEGISRCTVERLSCSISTIAFKEKIHNGELERIIGLGKLLGAASVRILYPTASGRLASAGGQLLGQEEKKKVRLLLDPDFVYLESTHVCTSGSERTCPSRQNKFFYVSCYGQVQPCPFVAREFGNLRRERIGKILERMRRQLSTDDKFRKGCLMDDGETDN